MTVLAHLALGLTVGAGVYLALRPTLASPLLSRTNHRGAPVATAAGLASTTRSCRRALCSRWPWVTVPFTGASLAPVGSNLSAPVRFRAPGFS